MKESSKENATGLRKYFGRPGVVVDRAQLALIETGGNDPTDPVCRAVTSTVVISPENKIMLPCYHFKDELIPIENNLYDLYTTMPRIQEAKRMEGRYDFCKGCTVYCYMRSSLFRRYPVDSCVLGAHYLKERARQRLTEMITRREPVFVAPQTAPRNVGRALPVL